MFYVRTQTRLYRQVSVVSYSFSRTGQRWAFARGKQIIMVTDPIADMLIRIKNAQMAHAERVLIPTSKIKSKIAQILKDAGYLADVDSKKKKGNKTEHEYLDVGLQYDAEDQGAINGIKVVSHPSRHLYIHAKDFRPVRSGYGMAVISTSKGVMTAKDARKENVGGEILFEIW